LDQKEVMNGREKWHPLLRTHRNQMKEREHRAQIVGELWAKSTKGGELLPIMGSQIKSGQIGPRPQHGKQKKIGYTHQWQ